MKQINDLSIVIPCKNEEKYIPFLLNSLIKQTYSIKKVPIFIADANSTDNTRKIINNFKKKHELKIKIISGGFPSYGRNAGAKSSSSKYILFIDADAILSPKAIEKSVFLIKKKNKDCVTVNIFCNSWDIMANILYILNNLCQYFSKFSKPYATGMFMLFRRKKFEELNGFDEKVLYAEDYFLTKQIERKKFGIASSYILESNRRFKKMGYFKIIKMFIKTALSRNSEYYSPDNKDYWK